MIRRMCTGLVLLLGLGGTAHGQCFLLDEGSNGLVMRAGYVGAEGVNGFEFDFGAALNRSVELGFGVGYASASNRWRGRSVTSSGQFLNFYPVRVGEGNTALLIGLHQTWSFTWSGPSNKVISGGASINMLLLNEQQTGLVCRFGFLAFQRMDSSDAVKLDSVLGAELVTSIGGDNSIALALDYRTGDSENSYAVGLAYTVSLN